MLATTSPRDRTTDEHRSAESYRSRGPALFDIAGSGPTGFGSVPPPPTGFGEESPMPAGSVPPARGGLGSESPPTGFGSESPPTGFVRESPTIGFESPRHAGFGSSPPQAGFRGAPPTIGFAPPAQAGFESPRARGRRGAERAAPPPPPIPQAARDLLAEASLGLGRACAATDAAERYALAHLAALRAGAAVLAARARPTRGRRGSVWALMSRVAPEFAEWAAFFAAGSAKRQAVQAGLPAGVTAREADDLVRQVAVFLSLVGDGIGTGQRPGPR